MADEKMRLKLGTTERRLDGGAVMKGIRTECAVRPGLFVLILPAAMYGPAYKAAIREMAEGGDFDEKFRDRFQDPAFVVRALVGGMDGISDENGEPVPYTPEIGLMVLSDPDNLDVLDWISTQALGVGNFYVKSVEADAKN